MKYRIIGADGKTYGPVELEQLRQWLAEGRVESRTPVYVEGAANWTYIGDLPEFAGQFSNIPSTIGPVTASASPSRGTNGFATAGLICGLLSWTCCCCPPFSILGVIFSVIALFQIRSQPQPQEGRMLAIAGLVLSVANLCFGLISGLLNLVLNPDVINSFNVAYGGN